MRNRHQVLILALVLVTVAASLFWYKVTRLGLPLEPGEETQVWTVEVRVSFRGTGGPAQVLLELPAATPGFGLLSENFVSRDYGLNTVTVGGSREAHWAVRRARGPEALYYRFVTYRDRTRTGDSSVPEFPKVPELEPPYAEAMAQLVTSVRARSANVATFTAEMIRRLNESDSDEEAALFRDWMDAPLAKAVTARTLLAGARIPARIAHGVRLGDDVRRATVEPWLEVHNGKRWLQFDLDTGAEYAPENFFIWWYGDEPLVRAEGARDLQAEVAIRRNVVDSVEVVERRAQLADSNVYRFSLFSLPVRSQAVYSLLLMLPLGALVMVIMRNLLGVPTFGTFTPVLVALAFRETKLLYGVLLFTLVVALGLTVRSYLERLHLLLVPRLASVLVVVVLMLVAISVVSQALDLETGLSVALFPMVILTMVIERMSITWEERGPGEAVKEGIGTLVVAAMAYLLMSIDRLEHLFFVFPELLLVLLAMTLLLGRYKGYRVSELIRFRALAKRA